MNITLAADSRPTFTRQLGAILLISGTTLGAGMLALPVVTGIAGFYPSALLLIVYWALSLVSALLLLEANLWFKAPTNLVGMTRHTLGRGAAMIAWCIYLLLLYSLTAAYLAGSGPLIAEIIYDLTGCTLPQYAQTAPLYFVFGWFIYRGIRAVDYLNRLLMVGLVLSCLALLILSSGYIDFQRLVHREPSFLWLSIPVISTSYGFHIIIPSLTNYLNRDVRSIKRTLAIGSVIPLIIYLLFEFSVLGIVGLNDLKEAFNQGEGITKSLCNIVQSSWIGISSKLFSFFAIVTSFLGVGLSLYNFFADELKIEQSVKGKLLTMALTFSLPILFVVFYPKGFILALEYAGIFVVLLLGILPVLIVWAGRKTQRAIGLYTVPGGAPFLVLVFLSFCTACAYMIMEVWGS